MVNNNLIKDKSADFALRIVNLYRFLYDSKNEKVLSKQILRSGTSIGANIAESVYASSKADFINKLQIAQKEAGETEFWLELLSKADYIDKKQFDSMLLDCKELLKLLTAILKKSKTTIDI